MKILILEDAYPTSDKWVKEFQARGHQCVSFIWVDGIVNGKITGHNRDKNLHTHDLASFDVALVDGVLAIPGMMGFECIPHIREVQLPFITTSSFGDIGGDVEMDKGEVINLIDEVLSYARGSQAA